MKETAQRKKKTRFAQELLTWNARDNDREMPWKGEKDPYKIWLSEVILQQTRVEQGWKYYENFIAAYPTIAALAAAPDEQVFKLWEGLGYYSRCRNLLATARTIVSEYGGRFPENYEAILALKGIGPYTAAAIASFAFGLPHAVLDGNVFRVLSRIFGIETPVDTTAGKKEFSALAQDTLAPEAPGAYNQAIMDFGATVCKPLPDCEACFFRDDCTAWRRGIQALLPVKEKKAVLKKRWLHYVVAVHDDQVLVRQRQEKDIWQSLYEFIPLEADRALTDRQLLKKWEELFGWKEYAWRLSVRDVRQQLSHQSLSICFVTVALPVPRPHDGYAWAGPARLAQLPFPRALKAFLDDHLAQATAARWR